MNKKFEKVMASTRKASKETVFRGDNAKNNGYGNLRHYTDDGYSGTNFKRPGFQELLADIEEDRVGTLIVKDKADRHLLPGFILTRVRERDPPCTRK